MNCMLHSRQLNFLIECQHRVCSHAIQLPAITNCTQQPLMLRLATLIDEIRSADGNQVQTEIISSSIYVEGFLRSFARGPAATCRAGTGPQSASR